MIELRTLGVARRAAAKDELGISGGGFWCDALSLEVCVAQGHFIEAVQLYEGEFLRGG